MDDLVIAALADEDPHPVAYRPATAFDDVVLHGVVVIPVRLAEKDVLAAILERQPNVVAMGA